MIMQEFTNDLVEKLIPLVKRKIVIPSNKMLFTQGINRNSVIIIFEGEYKLTHILPNSKEFTVGYYKAPNMLLPQFLDNNNPISLFRAEAKKNCTIGIIPFEEENFDKEIWRDFFYYNNFMAQKNYLQMRDLLFNTKRNALFSILIRFSNSYGIKVDDGIKITVKLSNIDLAEYTGTTPETISRILKIIKEDGLIKYQKKHIVITDIEYMKKELSCNCCNNKLCGI
ncbi:Crp/Fnr family transcriptional regulator [Clostridium sardiniense]|uniref:Crp/Fnr family transcriptional regulator n=1 Tax=Clostridium sardiniense TaxID=29369 RepID=UPI003D33CA76